MAAARFRNSKTMVSKTSDRIPFNRSSIGRDALLTKMSIAFRKTVGTYVEDTADTTKAMRMRITVLRHRGR
jgi:hypothetical protein